MQGQAAVVQGDDGADQRQAEAVAGGAARAVEADEAFQHVVAFVRRDAFAVIGDVDQDVVTAFFGAEADVAAAGRVFDGVIEQVGDGLRDELAVAHDVEIGFDAGGEGVFAVFAQDVVEFGKVFADVAQAGVGEVVFGAAFDLRDAEEGIEGFEQVFGVFDGVGDDVAQGFVVAVAVEQCHFHAVAQAVQRASEVVGDVVCHLPLAGDEGFDAIEHMVQVVGELVHFVGVVGTDGDAFGEVAVHDTPRGARDARDAVDDGVADEEGADEGDKDEEAGDVDGVIQHPPQHFPLVCGVVGGDEGVAVVSGVDDDDAHDEVDAHAAADAVIGIGGVDAAEVGDAAVEDDEVGDVAVHAGGYAVARCADGAVGCKTVGEGVVVAVAADVVCAAATGGDAEGDVRVAGDAFDDAEHRGVEADTGAFFKAAAQAGGFGEEAGVDLFADFFFGAAVEGVHRDAGDEARCQGKE